MSDPVDVSRITLMPDALTLLRIPKSNLDVCTKQLIRLAFFNDSYVPSLVTPNGGASVAWNSTKGGLRSKPKFPSSTG